jgi:hypothetical protein
MSKKCAYRINVIEDGVTVCEHHYDNAIDAVEAWNSYVDYGHARIRTLSFFGAAGDMSVKQYKDPFYAEQIG